MELAIEYRGSQSFFFPNMYDFFPPSESFRDLMTEWESRIADTIWFCCLLARHGLLTYDSIEVTILEEWFFSFRVKG